MNTLRKGTALVVDDEADVRRILGDMLVVAGCEVKTAGDAQSALEIIDQGGIDKIGRAHV